MASARPFPPVVTDLIRLAGSNIGKELDARCVFGDFSHP